MKKITYVLIMILVIGFVSCASNPEENINSVDNIVFNANGGSGKIGSLMVSKDGTVALPVNTYVKEGYNFVGWDVNEDGVYDFADGETFSINDVSAKDLQTLKALWTPIK